MAVAVDGRGCWTSGQPKLNNPSCRGCGCRKRESECLKPPLCVSAAAPARERGSSPPAHRTTAAPTHARTTTAHNTAHSTKGTSVRHCALLTGARFLLGRGGLSTHRLLQSCDRPQPPTVICIHPLFGPSEPSPRNSPAKPRASLASLLNQTLCKLSPLPFGVRRWFDYVAASRLSSFTPTHRLHRTAAGFAVTGVFRHPICRLCICICKLGAKRPQLALKFGLALAAAHSHHPRPSPHTAAVASLPPTPAT